MFARSLFSTLPFVVCLLWTVIVGLDNIKGWEKYDRKYLFFFMMACALLYLGHAVHFNSPEGRLGFTDCIYAGANLLVYPLFYLYLKQLTTPVPLKWQVPVAALPGFLVFCFSIYELYVLGRMDITHSLNRILFPLTVVLSCAGGFICLRKHSRYVREMYSNTDRKTFDQMSVLMALMLVASAMSIGLNHLGRDYFGQQLLLAVPSTFFSCILFAIAYSALQIDFSAQDAVLDFQQVPEETGENGNLVELANKLDSIMAGEELFLQPNLKITELAQLSGSNRTYVSNAINGIKGVPFSDYVNGYRVARAKELLLSDKGYTMNVVAEKSGFLSDATFYRQFKALTGLTPSRWLKSVKG